MIEASLGLLAMLILAFARVPLAIAMGLVGFAGLWWMRGMNPAMASVTSTVYESGFEYTLSVVPLFILMGNFVTRAGMSRELYRAAYTLVVGSVCGSSIATAATMTKVAYPSMKEHGYSGQLAAGAIAAGGTLGILIPPSTILVIYGLVTETNIGKLFAAGFLPGILAVVMMCMTIAYLTWRNPEMGPAAERSSWSERFNALKDVWSVAVLFVVVMGGIYGGVFTTTEGAGIGAFGAFVIAILRGTLNVRVTLEILTDSARTTGMLFMILVGALVFANFINFTSMPSDLKNLVSSNNISPMTVMIAICAIYIVLGAAMEELSIVLLTLPVFFPLVVGLGFDPVWFGIIIVLVVMIGLISPPVGMNMFVVRNMLPELSTMTVFKGVLPFVYTLIAVLALLVAFPEIALFLPRALKL